jgi:hypothetical protein
MAGCGIFSSKQKDTFLKGKLLNGEQTISRDENIIINKNELSSTGINPYFILKPGYQLILQGKDDDDNIQLIITVLDETKNIDGVETRVVEEKKIDDGILTELLRNYFAISQKDQSVFYFGQDLNIYNKKGQMIDNSESWQAGSRGAKAGLMMPGVIRVGLQHYQEIVPGIAMDRSEIVSLTEIINLPAGRFENVLKVAETSSLELNDKEYKFYAPGIGCIKDGGLELVKYGNIK